MKVAADMLSRCPWRYPVLAQYPRKHGTRRDAFRKLRRFLMTTQKLTEDEAIALMSVAADFGVTQVVDGNWGVHAVIKKSLFAAQLV